MKRMTAILLVALMAMSAFACTQMTGTQTQTENPLKKIAGTWKVQDVKAAGQTLPLDQIAGYGLDLVITLKSDGTGTIATPSNPQFTASITYNETTATYLDTQVPFTFDGSNHISLDYSLKGMTFTITLVKIAAEENPMAGMWTVTDIKVSGRALSMDEMVETGLYLVVVLNEDGTGIVTSPMYPRLRESITYSDNTVNYKDLQIPYNFDGTRISFDYTANNTTFSVIMTKN